MDRSKVSKFSNGAALVDSYTEDDDRSRGERPDTEGCCLYMVNGDHCNKEVLDWWKRGGLA